jgi:hypothetical protein
MNINEWMGYLRRTNLTGFFLVPGPFYATYNPITFAVHMPQYVVPDMRLFRHRRLDVLKPNLPLINSTIELPVDLVRIVVLISWASAVLVIVCECVVPSIEGYLSALLDVG